MLALRIFTAILLCCLLPIATIAAESQVGYAVIYSGGSLPNVKGGEELKLYLDAKQIRLRHKSQDVVVIPSNAVTEVSYGQEVHRRIGTAAGLAVVSLGIGALVAFSKSKKHYIGITWANLDNKGGVVLQADKNEYRGLLTALEGVTGKAAVDTDSPRQPSPAATMTTAGAPQETQRPASPPEAEVKSQPAQPQASSTASAPPQPLSVTRTQAVAQPQAAPQSKPVERIVVRFTSTPVNAEVQIDGDYWGSTPTADFTRIEAGPHTILIKKPGYQAWERKITLAAGDDRTVSAELELEPKDSSKPRISGQQ